MDTTKPPREDYINTNQDAEFSRTTLAAATQRHGCRPFSMTDY